MDIVSLSGYAAGTLTTLAYVPQAWKVLRTRHTKDISLTTYIMLVAGVVLWTLYGLWLRDWALLVSNAVALVFMIPILVMKIRLG